MIGLFQAAQKIQTFIQSNEWEFCFIGGIALQRWGESRLTVDIDISLLTRFKNEDQYIDALLDFLPSRVDDPKTFALQHRVLLLKTESEIGVDIALAGIPFEEEVIHRATAFQFLEHINLFTCSAEDLIIMKAFAARDIDWADIRGILIRQDNLDWSLILQELKPLVELKQAPEIVVRLEKMRKELGV